MGVPKSKLGAEPVYVWYDYEDVMFRWDGVARKFFRRFVGEVAETEVPHDSYLLNDTLQFGTPISSDAYHFQP